MQSEKIKITGKYDAVFKKIVSEYKKRIRKNEKYIFRTINE